MAATTSVQNGTHARTSRSEARTLDDLARLGTRELGALYAGGTVPESIDVLDGDLVGRMLAVRRLDRGGALRRLASFSRGRAFPWEGKSFRHDSATTGTGINRVKLAGTRRLFPFATHVGASVVDDRPTVVLDYDQPENPKVIRMIHDEIREVAPKLFLGPACMKRGVGRPAIVLWFALDAAR